MNGISIQIQSEQHWEILKFQLKFNNVYGRWKKLKHFERRKRIVEVQ